MNLREAKRFVDGFKFLEAPKWRDGQLWVSDVFDHRVYAIDAEGGRRVVCEAPHRPGGLDFLPDGTMIVASAADRKLLKVDGGRTSVYADLWLHATGPINDFAVDGLGRIYVGNFGYDLHAGDPPKATSIHRVDPDGTITTVANDVDFPNGSVVIDNGGTLIVAETWIGRLTAFDLDARGELSNRRIFADLGGRQPDGVCADAEGAIWAGCYNTGEFVRVLDGGRITDRFQFEGHAVSCTLGGEDGRQLFMTVFLGPEEEIAAGLRKSAVFKASVDVPSGALTGDSPFIAND